MYSVFMIRFVQELFGDHTQGCCSEDAGRLKDIVVNFEGYMIYFDDIAKLFISLLSQI